MRMAIGSALVFLFVGTGQAAQPEISPAQTVNYVISTYREASVRPELGFALRYLPPFLEVSWQRKVTLPESETVQYELERVSIDLRYAHFDAWNDGRRDRNVMVVECWNYAPCFHDEIRQLAYGHGEIDYLVSEFGSVPIASALNHLGAANEKSRPKPAFQ